jgi:hypothetical protein
MRLQHLMQTANALSCDDPSRAAAKGKTTNARVSIDRIHEVKHHFKGEPGTRKSISPSRMLRTALHALDGFLTGPERVTGQLR